MTKKRFHTRCRYLISKQILRQIRLLQWRHNDHDGVSNHQPHGCILNRLFRRRLKKTSKHRVTGHCAGNSPGPVNSPHKGPVTRKIFPFDDVIMHQERTIREYITKGTYFGMCARCSSTNTSHGSQRKNVLRAEKTTRQVLCAVDI